ncbi:MAG: GWxTD domain-containing protein, partial [Candidatus Latescibacteria bacterium]|nr:GWxTD domain-containing protein [Candidatus Latescibacterota bacterium]
VYYGPRLGYGWPETSGSLLKGIGLGNELSRRVDRAFVARLSEPDTAMARKARDVLEVIVERESDDLLARAAVGYAYFAGGDLPFGERTFNDVHTKGGVLPEVYNGIGLARMGRKKWNEAQAAFDQALTLRPDWHIARVNAELAQFLSGKRNWIGRLDTLLALSPRHPEWWYAKGRLREQMGNWESAEKAYAHQAAVNPMHVRARFDLARVWFRQERYAQAAAVWRHLSETWPELRDECLDPMLSAYLKTGDTGRAQAVIAAYLRSMDDETRVLMQDIRLVASVEELATYEALSVEARPAFERSFWQRRDPTPVTSGNERLVEHYRRVLHAMTHFSEGQKPWDKRGEIYIRYGPPEHVSKSDDVRYETDADVVKVKERLLMSLTPEAHKEIIARMGRLRTSTRDVQYQGEDAGDLVIADFESIDYELNPNRTFFGGGADRNDGQYYDDKQDSHRDRDAGMTNIRGFPIFPVDGGTRWEYWIYPDVAGGIEIVFTALDSRGVFDFPEMPQGRVLSTFNQSQWTQKRPDRVVARAVRQQAEIYRSRTNDLEFHFDVVDFRGQNPRTRLEVYYGVPLAAL